MDRDESQKAEDFWTATGQDAVVVIVSPNRCHLALAAVVFVVAGCGGHAASRQTTATGINAPRSPSATSHAAPAAVVTACRALARSRTLAVLCPIRLPKGRWAVSHRTLRNGRCAYLLDLNTRPFGQNIPFHGLAGGRCGQWPLTIRSGHWPADPVLANDLGLIGAKPLRPGQPGDTTPTPVPPRVLRRIDIAGHHGLLLLQEAGYPSGGVHGGHIAAIWNQGGDSYVLSLHFTEQPHAITIWQQMVIDAAEAMSRSPKPIAPETALRSPRAPGT